MSRHIQTKKAQRIPGQRIKVDELAFSSGELPRSNQLLLVLRYDYLSKQNLSFPFFGMTGSAPRILSISYDESLLRMREWILKGVGFQVTSAFGFTEAFTHCDNSAFDLAIIGHSIPKKDKLVLIRQLRKHNHTRVLSLRRAGEESLPGVDHSVEPSLGAEAFIEAVQNALGKGSSQAANSGTV